MKRKFLSLFLSSMLFCSAGTVAFASEIEDIEPDVSVSEEVSIETSNNDIVKEALDACELDTENLSTDYSSSAENSKIKENEAAENITSEEAISQENISENTKVVNSVSEDIIEESEVIETESDILEDEIVLEEDEKSEIYTVVFVDNVTGDEFARYEVEKNASVEALPEAPIHENWDFIGYSGDYTNVTSNRTITAIYEKAIIINEVEMQANIAGRTYNEAGDYSPNQSIVLEINGNQESFTSDDMAYYMISIDEDSEFVGTITFFENDIAIKRIIIHTPGAEVNDEYISSVRLNKIDNTEEDISDTTDSVESKDAAKTDDESITESNSLEPNKSESEVIDNTKINSNENISSEDAAKSDEEANDGDTKDEAEDYLEPEKIEVEATSVETYEPLPEDYTGSEEIEVFEATDEMILNE